MTSFTLEVENTLTDFYVRGIPAAVNPECVLSEAAPSQGLPDRIIKNTQAWDVTFKWQVDGPTALAMGPCNWLLNVYLLKLSGGGGAVQAAPTTTVPYAVGNPIPDNYIVTINIPASAVPVGLYKLYTSVEIQSPAVIPVTMFGEGPVMKIYKP